MSFEDDNNLLPLSEQGGAPGELVSDYYTLRVKPVLRDGAYLLRLREFENERSTFDEVKLYYIDHVPQHRVHVGPDGQAAEYEILSVRSSRELGAMAWGATSAEPQEGDVMKVAHGISIPLRFAEMGRIHARGGYGVIVRGQAPMKPIETGRVGRAGNAQAGFTLRERSSVALVMIPELTDDLEMVMEHEAGIETAELVRVFEEIPRLRPTTTIDAREDGGAQVAGALLQSDGRSVTLNPGHHIELKVTAPPVPAGAVRTFVLLTRGRYEHLDSEALPAESDGAASATRFAIARPGGLAGPASIAYSLSETGDVEITAYDLSGRRYAVIDAGRRERGEHTARWQTDAVQAGVYFLRMVVTDARGRRTESGAMKLVVAR